MLVQRLVKENYEQTRLIQHLASRMDALDLSLQQCIEEALKWREVRGPEPGPGIQEPTPAAPLS